jgi:hypothetical protein
VLVLHLVHWCCLVLALANYPNCINLTKTTPTQKSQLKCGKKISPKKFVKILRIVFSPNTQGICNRTFFYSLGFVARM